MTNRKADRTKRQPFDCAQGLGPGRREEGVALILVLLAMLVTTRQFSRRRPAPIML